MVHFLVAPFCHASATFVPLLPRGVTVGSVSMRKIRTLAVVPGCWLVLTVCCAADVVTQPLRSYGLGDLQEAAISPDRRWMATCGPGGAFIWDFENGTVRHRLEGHRARVAESDRFLDVGKEL